MRAQDKKTGRQSLQQPRHKMSRLNASVAFPINRRRHVGIRATS